MPVLVAVANIGQCQGARVVNRKQVVSRLRDQIVPAELECANCSWHATVGVH